MFDVRANTSGLLMLQLSGASSFLLQPSLTIVVMSGDTIASSFQAIFIQLLITLLFANLHLTFKQECIRITNHAFQADGS